MSLRWKILVLAVVAALWSIGSVSSGPAQTKLQASTKLYPFSSGQLKLLVPAGWVDEVQGSSSEGPVTLTFRPAQGNRFLVRWSVSWDGKAGSGFNAPARLQDIVRAAGSQLLPHATEKQLQLLEIKGPGSRGCYVPLTVRAPQPGDYERMAQGAVAVGELLIVFTYQGHSAGEADFNALLELIRTAGMVKAETRR